MNRLLLVETGVGAGQYGLHAPGAHLYLVRDSAADAV